MISRKLASSSTSVRILTEIALPNTPSLERSASGRNREMSPRNFFLHLSDKSPIDIHDLRIDTGVPGLINSTTRSVAFYKVATSLFMG